jgi:beta-galactosidase
MENNMHHTGKKRVPGFRVIRRVAVVALAIQSAAALAAAQQTVAHPNWPGPGQLFVGSCYQPIDRSTQEIDNDIAIMKGAGFNIVRMGDLSWDSFEPSQGKFTFEWFDKVMDKMQANGIKVILDIPGSPAPIWLHRRYPGVDIVNQFGQRNATWTTSATLTTLGNSESWQRP